MHEAGYAHRDVKPANVVWLPRDDSWHIIDFGCAARIGSRAPVTFSLTYAAPEVLAAAEINAELVEVFPEVDVWAFGVMAFELLTGEPAFQGRGNHQVVCFTVSQGLYSWLQDILKSIHTHACS